MIKVSGGFRTRVGAKEFVTNRGYITTAQKNDQNIFQAIQAAFEKHPFVS